MVGFKYSTDVETKKSQSIENNCNINSLNKKMKLCKPPENFQQKYRNYKEESN